MKLKWILVFFNLSALFYFKYLKYINFSNIDWINSIVLPIGISYFVFEQVAFVFDAFNSPDKKIDYHLGHYLSASLFFAKFISGPIERLFTLTKSFVIVRDIDQDEMRGSCLLIFWGLFKKIIIVDNLYFVSTHVLESQRNFRGVALMLVVLLNKYQIWANFSSYTDIARGIARFFGIELLENFKRPFNSVTIREFWQKWHLSLSHWIRDYVFYPLLATPLSRLGIWSITLITFLIFAIWHDLKLTFVCYAFIQVLLIYASTKISPTIEKNLNLIQSPWILRAIRLLRIIFVYVFLLALPSILFTVDDLGEARSIFLNLFDFKFNNLEFYLSKFQINIGLTLFFIVFVEWIEMKRESFSLVNYLKARSYLSETVFYVFIFFFLIYFLKISSGINFLYIKY